MRVKTRKEHKCLDCGTIISKSATRCLSCENKNRSKIEEKITREELK
jgi:predicted ATP-dependent serine protease